MSTLLNEPHVNPAPVIGILLAAGRGRRFDPTGRRNKLLQLLPDQTPVVLQSLRTLRQATDAVLVVVAPGTDPLQALLRNEGVHVVVCETADEGMAESLKTALLASLDLHVSSTDTCLKKPGDPVQLPVSAPFTGWVVALADMPFVQLETVQLLAHALRNRARVAIPVFQGRRGNPVAFSCGCLSDLLALRGDTGARAMLSADHVQRIAVNDPGVVRDIDQPCDL